MTALITGVIRVRMFSTILPALTTVLGNTLILARTISISYTADQSHFPVMPPGHCSVTEFQGFRSLRPVCLLFPEQRPAGIDRSVKSGA